MPVLGREYRVPGRLVLALSAVLLLGVFAQVSYDSSRLHGADPVDSVFAWNVPYGDVAGSTRGGEQNGRGDNSRRGHSASTSFGLADGVPLDGSSAHPGQDNNRDAMLRLAQRVSVSRSSR